MPITFLQLAEKILKEKEQPLSPSEIWQIAQTEGYDKEVATKGKTPEATLGAQLYVEVRDNPTSIFAATSSRPKRFFLRSLTDIDDKILKSQPVSIPKRQDYQEKELHPFVVYYGFYYLKAYLKTIHHNKSQKREFRVREWVQPRYSGMLFPVR